VPRDARLINHTSAGHEQSVAGSVPILALDMYEHAYHLEFGANPAAYVAAFMRNIDLEHCAGAVPKRREGGAAARKLIQKTVSPISRRSRFEEVKGMLDLREAGCRS